jgi:UDP-N-acetylglucosamine:LPS N-acetylglucosamine transferase
MSLGWILARRGYGSHVSRLLLVCSSGGHLAQMMAMAPWWRSHERAWVTFRTPDAESLLHGEDVTWAFHPTTRNAVNAVRNLFAAVKLLPRFKPDVIVSTGAGVAVPYFYAAKLFSIPAVFVEVYDRIDTPSMTGRLCRPVSSLVCVQSEEQTSFYPGAQVIGSLL